MISSARCANYNGMVYIAMQTCDTAAPDTDSRWRVLSVVGPAGPQGQQGSPGEVSNQQLNDAIAGTSANTNSIQLLNLTVSDPPTQSELQTVANKMDELINAMRR